MEALTIYCIVLAGPIAMSATETVTDGALIELGQADCDQLKRWGIVREATEAEIAAHTSIEVASAPIAEEVAPPEPPVAETAAQRKKRLAEEAEAARIAEEAAASEVQPS